MFLFRNEEEIVEKTRLKIEDDFFWAVTVTRSRSGVYSRLLDTVIRQNFWSESSVLKLEIEGKKSRKQKKLTE